MMYDRPIRSTDAYITVDSGGMMYLPDHVHLSASQLRIQEWIFSSRRVRR